MAENDNQSPVKIELPSDVEAEKAVLGSMMKSSDAVSDVIDMVKPEDFYVKEHQEIYAAMVDMYRHSVNIDITTVHSELKKRKTAEMTGGLSYLLRLTSDAIVPTNARFYGQTVVSKARLRALIGQADIIKSKALEGKEPADQILDFAEQQIFEIAQSGQKKNYEDLNDVLIRNVEELQKLQEEGGDITGITTGFRDLDKLLGGLQRTDLVILAARPGMGKTAFALNVARNAAAAGNSVMIFSMEMSSEQLGMRILSMSSNVEMETLKHGSLTPEDWMSVDAALDEFEDVNINITDATDMSILEMKNKCRRLKSEKGLDLIVIDYLQLMSLGYGVDNRVNEVSAITRNIKILAKELDCAVVLLSQLSRNSEKRPDHRPQLSDLRDSGSIEQDADIVIFLKRDDYYTEDDEPAEIAPNNTCEVIIAKHRSGPTGTVNLAWVAKYTKFANLEYRPDDF